MKTRLKLSTITTAKLSQSQIRIYVASSLLVSVILTILVLYLNMGSSNEILAKEKAVLRNNSFDESIILKVERLEGGVNSSFIELNPIVTNEGLTLYFGRKKHPENIGGEQDFEDIWVSNYDESSSTWSTPENVIDLNNEGPNFICAITHFADRKFALLGNVYGKNGKMSNGLSYSYFMDGNWQKPEKMKIRDFYSLSEKVDYTMSLDGNVIVMSINRGDSQGDRDLYVLFKEGEDKWSAPVNMGNVINSDLEDATPFISENGEYLYFSSRGHGGYGGSDIFVSKRLDDTWTNWSIPVNLGSKINTSLDEEYFHLPPKGNYAYFTRGINDKDMDIYRIEIDSLQAEDKYVMALE